MDSLLFSAPSARPRFEEHPFSDPEAFFFYHTIDVQNGTLRVQVPGPNIGMTFFHKRIPGVLCASVLERKTAGFLAISHSQPVIPRQPPEDVGQPPSRIIAWAQSGHGMGSRGDLLLHGDFVLSNSFWTERTIEMAAVLGILIAHPYDQGHEKVHDEARRGAYQASHVEVKLATHAVHALLATFDVPYDPRNLTRGTLERLRTCRYRDGSAPVVDIYFSRKNCPRCGLFVARLQASTGVTFRLIWRHRLTRVEYKNEMPPAGPGGPEKTILINEYDDDDDDEIWLDEAIDIDGPSDLAAPTATEETIVIDDPDEEVQVLRTTRKVDLVDLTATEPSSAASPNGNRHLDDAINGFLDSISFALGQFSYRPDTAREAAVDLARGLRKQRENAKTTATPRNRGRTTTNTRAQPRSAPARMVGRPPNRSLTPGRPRAPSPATIELRDRSRSPPRLIDLTETGVPGRQDKRRRRLRDC